MHSLPCYSLLFFKLIYHCRALSLPIYIFFKCCSPLVLFHLLIQWSLLYAPECFWLPPLLSPSHVNFLIFIQVLRQSSLFSLLHIPSPLLPLLGVNCWIGGRTPTTCCPLSTGWVYWWERMKNSLIVEIILLYGCEGECLVRVDGGVVKSPGNPLL